ncbi:nuclease domain-containing protein [Limosilactobacillus reuteri]|uniref:nuclease domain-containing protein n=1 Tax=Limosilactobacillus reuteri TaxID=1598 RepID=UPI003991A1D4
MVMQDNIFLEGNNHLRKRFIFSDNELDDNQLEICENSECYLYFEEPRDGKLYMDGLDLLSDDRISHDNEGLFIQASEKPYYIYDYSQNDKKYLPGLYRLKLVTADAVKYSWLKVVPKFLSENSLELMRQDVENTVKGLARSFRANTNGSLSNYSSLLRYEEVQALSVLHENYQDFSLNSYFISQSPRVRTSSYYSWSRNPKRSLDNKSIIKMSMENHNRDLYLKNYRLTNNTSENGVLKKTLSNILHLVNQIYIDLSNINKRVGSHSLKEDLRLISKYKMMLNYLLNNTWLKNVKTIHGNRGIDNAYLDHRYIYFRNLYWKLMHVSNFQPQFSRQYQYYWHRTDLLYEIWGYIKVIEVLNKLGFIPQRGWIYDNVNLDFRGLKSGTCIHMRSSNSQYKHLMNLKVKYDSVIKPNDVNRVTPSNPLWYSSSHNRPDIRIEIYDQDMIFQNAIILDTKYRRLKDINSFGKGGALEQLNSYHDQIFSPYPFETQKYEKYKQLQYKDTNSILDVAALYPGDINVDSEQSDILKAGRAKYVVLNPKFPKLNALTTFLKNCFDNQEQFFERFNEWDKLLDNKG